MGGGGLGGSSHMMVEEQGEDMEAEEGPMGGQSNRGMETPIFHNYDVEMQEVPEAPRRSPSPNRSIPLHLSPQSQITLACLAQGLADETPPLPPSQGVPVAPVGVRELDPVGGEGL